MNLATPVGHHLLQGPKWQDLQGRLRAATRFVEQQLDHVAAALDHRRLQRRQLALVGVRPRLQQRVAVAARPRPPRRPSRPAGSRSTRTWRRRRRREGPRLVPTPWTSSSPPAPIF